MRTHLANRALELTFAYTSLVNFTVYNKLPSLSERTVQQLFSVVTTEDGSNLTADLCLLLIYDILWVYFPFSSFVSLSKILSFAIFKSICRRKSIRLLLFCSKYTIFNVLWNDSRNIFVLTIVPERKHDAHCSKRLH